MIEKKNSIIIRASRVALALVEIFITNLFSAWSGGGGGHAPIDRQWGTQRYENDNT